MAKSDYRGNLSSAKNVGFLKGRLSGKRALILSDYLPDLDTLDDITSFFDVIIVEGFKALKGWPQPDIFIDTEASPYFNFCLRENRYQGLDKTLVCLNFKNALEMKKARLKHKNIILTYMPVEARPSNALKSVEGISFGLSEHMPGIHLALLGGCTDIYCSSESDIATHLNYEKLIDFIEEEESIAPYVTVKKNLIRRRRGAYLDENGM